MVLFFFFFCVGLLFKEAALRPLYRRIIGATSKSMDREVENFNFFSLNETLPPKIFFFLHLYISFKSHSGLKKNTLLVLELEKYLILI